MTDDDTYRIPRTERRVRRYLAASRRARVDSEVRGLLSRMIAELAAAEPAPVPEDSGVEMTLRLLDR